MSSLASLFVAKAKATPEKVVPLRAVSFRSHRTEVVGHRKTYKIDTDNQLRLALTGALDLSSRVAPELLGNWASWRRRSTRRVSGLSTKARRTAAHGWRAPHRIHVWGWVACIDGRGASSYLARWCAVLAVVERARTSKGARWRALLIARGIAGRAIACARVVHRKTGRGGGGAERRRLAGYRQLRMLAGRRGLAGRLLAVDRVLDASSGFPFTKAKAFEARIHRAHREWREGGKEGRD